MIGLSAVFGAVLSVSHVCTNFYTVPTGASTTGLCSVPAEAPLQDDGRRPDVSVTVISGNRFVIAGIYEITQSFAGDVLVANWQVRIHLVNFGPFDESGLWRVEIRYPNLLASGFEQD